MVLGSDIVRIENGVVRALDEIKLWQVARRVSSSNLQDGEVVCGECQGGIRYGWLLSCLRCGGTGKLDWIENIVGKKREIL